MTGRKGGFAELYMSLINDKGMTMYESTEPLEKLLIPFDKLRVSGGWVEFIDFYRAW